MNDHATTYTPQVADDGGLWQFLTTPGGGRELLGELLGAGDGYIGFGTVLVVAFIVTGPAVRLALTLGFGFIMPALALREPQTERIPWGDFAYLPGLWLAFFAGPLAVLVLTVPELGLAALAVGLGPLAWLTVRNLRLPGPPPCNAPDYLSCTRGYGWRSHQERCA